MESHTEQGALKEHYSCQVSLTLNLEDNEIAQESSEAEHVGHAWLFFEGGLVRAGCCNRIPLTE